MRAAMEIGHRDPEALRHRHARGLRLLPALPGRDRGPRRHARLLHHAGRRRHGRSAPRRERLDALRNGRDGALHLRPSRSTASTCAGQRRLRAAGHGRRGRPARGRCATAPATSTPVPDAEPAHMRRTVQPLFQLRPGEVHRLLALRARLRGGAGHLRADHRGPRLRQPRRRPAWTKPFLDSECVSCGACVQACPTGDADREGASIEIGAPEHSVITTCAYCGVGCSFKAEMQRRGGRAHGAVEGRQGQPRPFLRQGPLRLGLRHPPRPHPRSR